MVLLTSGHVTVIISSAVVSLFTFLLFLAGYVVQQQTVRSLHEVFHPPPVPIPTLPVFFSDVENTTVSDGVTNTEESSESEPSMPAFKPIRGSSRQEVLAYVKSVMPPELNNPESSIEGAEQQGPDLQNSILVQAPSQDLLIASEENEGVNNKEDVTTGDTTTGSQVSTGGDPAAPFAETNGPGSDEKSTDDSPMEASEPQITEGQSQQEQQVTTDVPVSDANSRLSYLMLAPTPSSICSSILFYSHLSYQKTDIPNRMILYPSFWMSSVRSSSDSEAYVTALALLHEASIEHGLSVHELPFPESVDIASLHSSAAIEKVMLAALAEPSVMKLPFLESMDSLLYIQSPGLLLDSSALDNALISGASADELSSTWSPYNPTTDTSTVDFEHHSPLPTHLLLTLQNTTSSPPSSSDPPLSSLKLYTPSSPSTTSLVLASTTQNGAPISAIDLEAQMSSTHAAYILFSESELRGRQEKKDWWSGVYERFERGRREVCPAEIDRDLQIGRRSVGDGDLDEEQVGDRSRGW